MVSRRSHANAAPDSVALISARFAIDAGPHKASISLRKCASWAIQYCFLTRKTSLCRKARAALDKFKSDQSAALKRPFSTARLQRELLALQNPKNLYALLSGFARNAEFRGQKQEERTDAISAQVNDEQGQDLVPPWLQEGVDSRLGNGPLLRVQALRLRELLGEQKSRARE